MGKHSIEHRLSGIEKDVEWIKKIQWIIVSSLIGNIGLTLYSI